MSKKIKFDSILRKIKQQQRAVAFEIANKAVNHFKNNFQEQGFVDEAVNKWRDRKNKDKGRAILVKTGLLKRSIKKIKVTPNSIVVGTNSTEYASYHNQGMGKIPKRQFIGRSKKLNDSIRYVIREYIKKAFK